MNPNDTLIWLINFPASHGYMMVFVAGFSIFGLFAMSARRTAPGGALRRIREREGLLPTAARPQGQLLRRVMQIVFRVLAIIMLTSLVLGILSLTGVPVTRAYIFDNGESATATMDGDWVTFTTSEGTEYTLKSDFITPSAYPDRRGFFPTDANLVVRYLPSHPQAFVIDTTQLPE